MVKVIVPKEVVGIPPISIVESVAFVSIRGCSIEIVETLRFTGRVMQLDSKAEGSKT